MSIEAMKQALEALEAKGDAWIVLERKAITALRERLAQPDPKEQNDPVVYHGWVLREVLFDNGEPVGHREPPKAEPQEPVQ